MLCNWNSCGNIICIRRNTDVTKSDLKKLHKKCLNRVDFPDGIFNFSKKCMCFSFHLMHGLRAMDVTVHLAPIFQVHSVLFQFYEFCLQAILLMLIDIHGSVANWSLGQIFITSIQISLIIFCFSF